MKTIASLTLISALLSGSVAGAAPLSPALSGWTLDSSLLSSPSEIKDSAPRSGQVFPLNSSADRMDLVAFNGSVSVAMGWIENQSVALLDLNNREVLWRSEVGFAPTVVKADPTRGLVYASGVNAPGLVVLDLKTGQRIRAYGLAAGVLDMTVDPQSGRVFATLPNARGVAVILPDQPQARMIPMPGPPLALVYDRIRGNLLVSLGGNDPLSLLVVNPVNGELLARWRSGNTPEDMVLDEANQRLVMLNSGSQDLSVLDLKSNGEQLQRIGLDWRPTRLDLSADGSRAYVTSRDSDRLQIVNLLTGRLESSLTVGDQPTGIRTLGTAQGSGVLVVEAGIPQLHWVALSDPSTLQTAALPALGAITGRVLTIANQPVKQGKLSLGSTASFPGKQLPIKPDGTYVIPEVPAGVYLMDVQVPGFPPTSVQVQVRSGFVSTQDVRLPIGEMDPKANGIGLLPDVPPLSDELARSLKAGIAQMDSQRRVLLLNGPLGPDPQFQELAPMVKDLSLIDRDERFTDDLRKLQVIGNALGLRYILLTQLQISRDFNRQGNSLVNTALRFLVPVIPVEIPNFTPNQLRSRGLVIVIDLQKTQPGDKARYYETYGQDDVGGDPMFEDAASGLFRQQVRNMVPEFIQQWKAANPFLGS